MIGDLVGVNCLDMLFMVLILVCICSVYFPCGLLILIWIRLNFGFGVRRKFVKFGVLFGFFFFVGFGF